MVSSKLDCIKVEVLGIDEEISNETKVNSCWFSDLGQNIFFYPYNLFPVTFTMV